MPDQFKEVITKGYGSRIGDSIKAVVAGLVLFVASFGLLYWNEGRVDVSLIAKTAVEVKADASDAASGEGKLVSVSGTAVTTETVGDGLFLKDGDYLAVSRTVEMYAWVEKKEEKTTTNTGGSETTETTYTYIKDWTSDPAKTTDFKSPQGHENPVKTIDDVRKAVSSAKVGTFSVDMAKVELPGFEKLPLSSEKINLVAQAGVTPILSGDYVYLGKGTISAPQVGDMRVSYQVLKNNVNVTVFGKLSSGVLSTYVDEKTNTQLYRMFTGTRDEAIAQMHGEYTMMLWIFRLVGFLMMWIGLSMFLGPISTVLDVLPILGSLSRSLVGVMTFVVALVLSIVTILVSMILHSLVAVIITLVVLIAIIIVVLKMKNKKGPTIVKA